MISIINSYIRNIRSRKSIHLITIGGFAVSLAVFILIYSFVIHEKSYDSMFPEIESMYRIKRDGNQGSIPLRAREKILRIAPEIKQLCLFNKSGLLYQYKEVKNYAEFVVTDESFFEVFSVEFIYGDKKNALQSKNNLVITESFAERQFGNINSLGEVMEFRDSTLKTVVAVIKDPPQNSSIQYDVIFNLENRYFGSGHTHNDVYYKLYDNAILLNENANKDSVQNKISLALQEYNLFKNTELSIQEFRDIYFDFKSSDDYKHANVKFIELLSVVALIILVLAIINYVNLSVASNLERFKEVCIRKTNGARIRTIIGQFLIESYISCFAALCFAIVFLLFFSSVLSSVLNLDFNVLDVIKQPQLILSIFGLVLFLGSIIGFVPAKIASRFNPIELIQRKTKSYKTGLASIFNTIQFIVALMLIIGLIVINKQLEFAKTKDMGFEKEHLLRVSLEGSIEEKTLAIKDQLLTHSSIINVSASSGNPLDVHGWGSGNFTVEGVTVEVEKLMNIPVDESFIETFKIPIIEGRDFRMSDKRACIINEKFYNSLNWDNLDNKNIWGATVIGVISDIHYDDLHHAIGNLRLLYNVKKSHFGVLNIRIANHEIPSTLAYIKSVIKEFDSAIKLDYTFYNDEINSLYHKEEEQASAIKLFALIAVFLTCLGLYGKIELTGKSRIKEIGIRKVNGARVGSLVALLNKDFVQWVAIAFVIATPLAHFTMTKWLENFAYKTTLSWWIFALAGVLALAIAIITVSWLSWQAARRNPVEALRYE